MSLKVIIDSSKVAVFEYIPHRCKVAKPWGHTAIDIPSSHIIFVMYLSMVSQYTLSVGVRRYSLFLNPGLHNYEPHNLL